MQDQAVAERRRRPRGAVRDGLVAAGLELARAGGPDAVVLREATRMVGVVPNAAYRHFASRDELLAAVCRAALRELADRMSAAVAADYLTLVEDAVAAHEKTPGQRRRTLGRLRRELHRIRARDYFPPPERELAKRAVDELAALVEEPVR